jgi:hypothetical protein
MNLRRSGAHGRSAQIVRIKRIHYVAPSVGAYNPGRVRKTALLLDAMLALQPFERFCCAAANPALLRLPGLFPPGSDKGNMRALLRFGPNRIGSEKPIFTPRGA